MSSFIPYNKNERGSFAENWPPHYTCSDIWQVQGILHEPSLPQAVYSYFLNIVKINTPLETFFTIEYSLGEVLKARDFTERVVVPVLKGKKAQLDFDEDSFFCGELAQVLDTERAYVVRLRGKGFGLDLCLTKEEPVVWYGDEGKIYLTQRHRDSHSFFGGVLPRMKTFGRLFLEGEDLRVEGISSLERLWGKNPARECLTHWEKIYLFFNDGDEIMLMNVPLANTVNGMFLPKNSQAMRLGGFTLKPVDYVELDEWRFSFLWHLTMPTINKGAYYLIPIIKDQFQLPVCRPTLGIFDKDGRNYGYGHAELMPGARNELDKVSINLFKNVYKK